MVNKAKWSLLRRSGVAVVTLADLLGWDPDAIFQVGIGHYHKESDVFREAWPDVPLVGFEAHPEIAEKESKNYPGVLIPRGVSSYSGKAILYSKKRHQDGSSLHPINSQPNCDVIEIDVVALDEFPQRIDGKGDHILLWLDCEGHELEVLKGAEEFTKKVDVINVEVTHNSGLEGGCTPREIHQWMTDHDYIRQHVHTNRCAIGQCDAVYVRSHLFNAKFCCDPPQFYEREIEK